MSLIYCFRPPAVADDCVQTHRLEMDLMDKVKQVSESYELQKLKTQNRTIELDARLSSERLLATKLRLNQMNGENEKLSRQLRSSQAQLREFEQKLLLTETMLRQFVGSAGNNSNDKQLNTLLMANSLSASGNGGLKVANNNQQQQQPIPIKRQVEKLRHGGVKFAPRSRTAATTGSTRRGNKSMASQQLNFNSDINNKSTPAPVFSLISAAAASASGNTNTNANDQDEKVAEVKLMRSTTSPNLSSLQATNSAKQPSRARAIINELRSRLNMGQSSSRVTIATATTPAEATTTTTIANDQQASGECVLPLMAI